MGFGGLARARQDLCSGEGRADAGESDLREPGVDAVGSEGFGAAAFGGVEAERGAAGPRQTQKELSQQVLRAQPRPLLSIRTGLSRTARQKLRKMSQSHELHHHGRGNRTDAHY